jgi:hypothetical protein
VLSLSLVILLEADDDAKKKVRDVAESFGNSKDLGLLFSFAATLTRPQCLIESFRTALFHRNERSWRSFDVRLRDLDRSLSILSS